MTVRSVLVVDDHPSPATSAAHALEAAGYIARVATSVDAALVEWATAPWRVSSHAVTATERGREVRRVVESRTLGAEELAGHRAAEGCYLRRWAAVRGEVQR